MINLRLTNHEYAENYKNRGIQSQNFAPGLYLMNNVSMNIIFLYQYIVCIKFKLMNPETAALVP